MYTVPRFKLDGNFDVCLVSELQTSRQTHLYTPALLRTSTFEGCAAYGGAIAYTAGCPPTVAPRTGTAEKLTYPGTRQRCRQAAGARTRALQVAPFEQPVLRASDLGVQTDAAQSVSIRWCVLFCTRSETLVMLGVKARQKDLEA